MMFLDPWPTPPQNYNNINNRLCWQTHTTRGEAITSMFIMSLLKTDINQILGGEKAAITKVEQISQKKGFDLCVTPDGEHTVEHTEDFTTNQDFKSPEIIDSLLIFVFCGHYLSFDLGLFGWQRREVGAFWVQQCSKYGCLLQLFLDEEVKVLRDQLRWNLGPYHCESHSIIWAPAPHLVLFTALSRFPVGIPSCLLSPEKNSRTKMDVWSQSEVERVLFEIMEGVNKCTQRGRRGKMLLLKFGLQDLLQVSETMRQKKRTWGQPPLCWGVHEQDTQPNLSVCASESSSPNTFSETDHNKMKKVQHLDSDLHTVHTHTYARIRPMKI